MTFDFKKTSIVYKIRRRTDGLYSGGGAWPDFSTEGKSWKRRSDLVNHLFNFYHPQSKGYEPSCQFEVVSIEVKETEIETQNLMEFENDANDRRHQAAQKMKKLQVERERKREYKQFLVLKEKFGGR